MVVKVCVNKQPQPYHANELQVLRHIRNIGGQPLSIAKLIWDPAEGTEGNNPESHIEFGISPRGKALSLGHFRNRDEVVIALADITLTALTYFPARAIPRHRQKLLLTQVD